MAREDGESEQRFRIGWLVWKGKGGKPFVQAYSEGTWHAVCDDTTTTSTLDDEPNTRPTSGMFKSGGSSFVTHTLGLHR